jgi:hypothetical protein
MQTIRSLLKIDLEQPIEEVIKLGQQDERAVYTEISEYVPTDRIRQHYRKLLKEIAEAPAEPQEGIGVWISGFFGSGKSSFAKNLGYVLMNRTVLDKPASELFKDRMDDQRIADLVDFINQRIPTEVLMFDVSVDRAVINQVERLAEVMYRVLLRELDYADDWAIANLEITLEGDGRLTDFIERFEQKYKAQVNERMGTWAARRKMATRYSEASSILHEMDKSTYPRADSWAESPAAKSADITVRKLVEDTFELMSRRKPGKAAVFIIDEVGQYVARSADKILDLQGVVREFGQYGRNQTVKKKALAPTWIIVTSQEKLDEVVAGIDSKRVDLAKLQDSFKHHIDLAPADIREVASRRVLTKSTQGEADLRRLYEKAQGQLNTYSKLERTTRRSEVTEDEFVQFYPYLPHFIELSIDIMSGIRLQPGAPKHIGGANRTIIKQAYEMLVNERTALGDKPVGTLVTIDKIFELVEGNLSSEKRNDITTIVDRFPGNPWPGRTAKAIALLEFVRDLPRSAENLAALLFDALDAPSPLENVRAALEQLLQSQFIRQTDDGYKLQTAQEKNWETERQSLEPKPKDVNEIKREALNDIFSDPKLRTYSYEDLRTLRTGIKVDDVSAGDEGQLTIQIFIAEDDDDFKTTSEMKSQLSRAPGQDESLFWVMPLSSETRNALLDLYRSREMIRKYSQFSGSNKLSTDESRLLSDEKTQESRVRARLREKMAEAFYRGVGYFRGVSKDGTALGHNHIEAVRGFLTYAVPSLYPKLRLGARPLRGSEAEDILKAANLSALPIVFYGGDGGTDLIREQNGKFMPNIEAEIAREVLSFIQRQHAYGNKVTGKDLEAFFQAMPYGWEYEMVLLVLAVLLRAGAIEITHQGRRFRNHQDPQARAPFSAKSKQSFKAASFAPRQSIELRTLTEAVKRFEELTGQEVDVEETAIAVAFKKLASDELAALLPLEARLSANRLPLVDAVTEYRSALQTALDSASDDCVRILAGEGRSLKELRDQVIRLRQVTTDSGLQSLRWARQVLETLWPEVSARPGDDEELKALTANADTLRTGLESEEYYLQLNAIKNTAKTINIAYRTRYEDLHLRRGDAYQEIVEEVTALEDWEKLSADVRVREMAAITRRADTDLDLQPNTTVCRNCSATLSQMESDLAAAAGLRAMIVDRIRALAAPEQKVERVRISNYIPANLTSEADIDEALARLRQRLVELLAEGVRIVLE